MGLLTKLASKTKETPKAASNKKATIWFTSSLANGEVLSKAVHELAEIQKQKKTLEAKEGVHKTILKKAAEENFLRDSATLGVLPETPMQLQNDDGEKATFVVQDRSGQYGIKEEQKEQLVEILGAQGAEDLLYTQTTFGFNPTILALPGVMDAVDAALERLMKKLVESDALTEDQVEKLIDCDQKVTLKPGSIERLPTIAGRDVVRMKNVMDAYGSCMVRYIKS